MSSSSGPTGGVSLGALRRKIHELSATVTALVDMLADAGALDREKLRARVEGMLEASREQATPMPDPWTPKRGDRRPEHGGAPYRDALPAEPMVDCATCGSRVPERLTVITASGVICDVCAARRA